jgi:hypothetical protein
MRYVDLWEQVPGLMFSSAESEWARRLTERVENVRMARRKKARRFAPLRRALLRWRRQWNLREIAPTRDPWVLDSALWTLHLIEVGAKPPSSLIVQPLGSLRLAERIADSPVPFEVEGWDWARGEPQRRFRERVERQLDEYCSAVGEAFLVKVGGANKAERDFDLLIRRCVLRVPMKQLVQEVSADLPDVLDHRTLQLAIVRAAKRVGLSR